MKKYILILAVALGLTSCERDANIDVPAIDPMLSVTCFISPQDTVLMAKVSRVNPIFGDEGDQDNYLISNATVTISNNGNTATLLYDPMSDTYTCPFEQLIIIPGQTYQLIVTAPDYPTLSAETTVPLEQPQGLSATLDRMNFTQNSFESTLDVIMDIEWTDVTAADSYYRGLVTFSDTTEFDGISTINHFQVISFYEKDEVTNGGTISQKQSGNIYYWQPLTPESFHFYLLNCTKEYYEFHKSVENINYSSPFSEPTLIYSNTRGGLGVFAAFQQSDIWINL